MNDVQLSRYRNEHGEKIKRLLWELVWRIFAATTPRWMCKGLRRAILRGFGATVGKDVRVHGHARVWLPQNLVIGDHSWIGGDANLYDVAPLRIGANAVISEEAFLCTAGHDITSERFALTTAPIEVGDMAWIGARAIVLPGRKVGAGAVVAAGAVVTHDVEPWTVVAGNPARVIRRREIRPPEHPKEHRGGLRILHVTSGLLNTGGGVSECVPEACRELNALGHDVGLVVCERGELSKSAIMAEQEGVTIYRFYGAPFKWNPICFTWRMFRELESVMRGYDIVHINGVWLFPTWWAAHVARKLGKPYVLRPHGSFMPDRLLISRWKKVPAGFFFDRPVVRGASAVLATCQEEEDAIRSYEPTAKAMTLPYVIDLSGAEKFQSFKVEKFQGCKVGGERTLLFFSRISYVKGLDILAEAWAQYVNSNTAPTWKLLVVGPDDRGYTEKMKQLFAEKCPAGSYEFRGPAYGADKWRLLADADVFILPTRSENLGIVIAEAMASRLPVICTKGAPWECLETENAGRWVDVSVEGVRKGIEELLALSDEERQAMGERGRKWVEANIGRTAVAQKMIECYSKLKG